MDWYVWECIFCSLCMRLCVSSAAHYAQCTFGFSVRAVLAAYGGDVRVVGCRFSSPVYPGDVLETRMWKEGPGLVLFDVRVGNSVVLSDGVCRFQQTAKL